LRQKALETQMNADAAQMNVLERVSFVPAFYAARIDEVPSGYVHLRCICVHLRLLLN